MKIVMVLAVLGLSFSLGVNASEDTTAVEKFQLCQQDCVAVAEPGFALKACLAECEDLLDEAAKVQYCNSYEEDCDRDDDDAI